MKIAQVSDKNWFGRVPYQCQYEWPEDCLCQGGSHGIVLGREGTTAFFEAFPRNPDTFIRGEGETVEEAETACWNKYQKYLACPSPTGQHEFEPRNYQNGAGVCKYCGFFGPQVFTGEELGQFCEICGVGTTYSPNNDDKEHVTWYCEKHFRDNPGKTARMLRKWADEADEEIAARKAKRAEK